jgi:hypothetical protein
VVIQVSRKSNACSRIGDRRTGNAAGTAGYGGEPGSKPWESGCIDSTIQVL